MYMFLRVTNNMRLVKMVYSPSKGSKAKTATNFGPKIIHDAKSTDNTVLRNVLDLPKLTVFYSHIYIYIFTNEDVANKTKMGTHGLPVAILKISAVKTVEKMNLSISKTQLLIIVDFQYITLNIFLRSEKSWMN